MSTRTADLNSLKIDRSQKDDPSWGKKKLIITTVVIVALVVIVYVIFINLGLSTPKVKITSVVLQKPGQSSASLIASGYVVAQRKAAIASKGTGRLIYLGVVEGDQVKKNQIIGRLEDNDIRAQLEQAKANLKLQEADLNDATNTYSRVKDLFKKGLSSQQEFDQAEANYNRILASIDVAKAGVQVAEVALENTLIRAPFDGTVLTKNAEVGEIVAPFGGSTTSKTAVVTIADMKSLLVEADVSESNIEKIKPEQDCEIVLDAYPEKSYPGFVFKIVPTADRSKATVLVKVGFKNYDSRVLPEMSAKVNFYTEKIDPALQEQKPVLILPNTSLRTVNGKTYAFKIENNSALQVKVTLGEKFGDYTEIKNGLSAGDQVIESLTDKIQNGTEVKIEE